MSMATETENGPDDERLYATRTRSGGVTESVKWRECVSQRVVAEGIAWGGTYKPAREYVVMDGERIFISGELLPNDKIQGRLVQVTGTLRVGEHPPVPPGFQPAGFGKFYFIQVETMKVVDHIECLSLIVIK